MGRCLYHSVGAAETNSCLLLTTGQNGELSYVQLSTGPGLGKDVPTSDHRKSRKRCLAASLKSIRRTCGFESAHPAGTPGWASPPLSWLCFSSGCSKRHYGLVQRSI